MEIIKFSTHIGTDGILKLELPVDTTDVIVDGVVVYTVRPKVAEEDWETFVNRTYGLLAHDPIERPVELPPDIRDEIE